MTSFTLKDDGQPFKKIVTGRQWVGRVLRHAIDGYYLGIIGQTTVKAATERQAFDEVVAQHLGFKSAAAMDARNAKVRAQNAVIRDEQRVVCAAFVQAFHGDYSALDRVFPKRA